MPIASAGPGTIQMIADLSKEMLAVTEQPISTEIYMADGVFTKSMVVRKAGTIIPQHSHRFSHVSVLVRGAVRVTANGDNLGDFTAPCGILIRAGVKHLFMTLVDDTIVLCVHDIGTAEGVEVLEEHQIVGG
jgi:quercetin dioxygenase-like cupin family protein